MTTEDQKGARKPVLTFRVTQRYNGGLAEGKITLSTETSERPYAVSRTQAEKLADELGATFKEKSNG